MGSLIDVRPTGLMEHILHKMGISTYRQADTTNALCFHVDFAKDNWGVPTPRQNDWSMSTRGSVIIRLTWDFLAWDIDTESRIISQCNKYIELFRMHVNETAVTEKTIEL
jgi:hypothetical protein